MIKTILFDFGDVFINLDKAATLRELEKLEVKSFSENDLKQNIDYEKGLLTSEAFVEAYLKTYPHLTEDGFKKSWNSILVDFPEYRLDFVKQLSKENKYQLILLSNTNHIHIDWVKENVMFFDEFRSCFDAFYLSQEINLRKPEPSIYQYVLEKHDLKPEEILFIDDTKENTDAASTLGIHTWNIDPKTEDVTQLFEIKKELF